MLGNLRLRNAADQLSTPVGQFADRDLRLLSEQGVGDQVAEDGVAEELQALVVGFALVAGRGVAERSVQQSRITKLVTELLGQGAQFLESGCGRFASSRRHGRGGVVVNSPSSLATNGSEGSRRTLRSRPPARECPELEPGFSLP